jgi:hypothetical protein
MSAEVRKYNAVEQWCHEKVSSGADFLFDPLLFHDALYKASKEFDFPFEVRSDQWFRLLSNSFTFSDELILFCARRRFNRSFATFTSCM